ncbi:MarR family transcriptional regulator [bacterium SCSIO 12741]|nr:MarR family transcriptional regulator [bacterium SCSIO 12741]
MNKEPELEGVIYFLMDKALRRSKRFSLRFFEEHGITMTIDQWVALRKINESDQISQIELAQAIDKDAASLTRILDILEKRNWVQRLRNPGDRRRFDLALTREGEKVAKQAYEVVKQIREIGVKGVSSSDLEAAMRVMRAIDKNME